MPIPMIITRFFGYPDPWPAMRAWGELFWFAYSKK